MQKELISPTTTIFWALEKGVQVSRPDLPQRDDPKCPVMEDGKVSFKSTMPNPGAADGVCKLSVEKNGTTLGIFNNGLFNTATAYDQQSKAYGKSGLLLNTAQVDLYEIGGRLRKSINIGPNCGQLEGDCEITSTTDAVPTQTPASTPVFRAEVDQAAPPLLELIPANICPPIVGIGLGLLFVGVIYIKYLTGGGGK